MLRVVAIHVLLLAIYLHLHLGGGVHATCTTTIRYNNAANPNAPSYVSLLEAVRAKLGSGVEAHNMSVLKRPADVLNSQRCLLVELQNGADNTITLALDVVNVYVMGYLVGNTFNYFTDTPQAFRDLLPTPPYQHRSLGFEGNYVGLGNRENVDLGHAALNQAIDSLFYGYINSQKPSLLVVIQMVSEASRIIYIEHQVRVNMIDPRNPNFRPDPQVLSLENNWAKLSEQIQWSGSNGLFTTPVTIRSPTNQEIVLNNVQQVRNNLATLALLLYKPKPVTSILYENPNQQWLDGFF